MSDCVLVPLPDGTHTCEACGFTRRITVAPERYHRRCPGRPGSPAPAAPAGKPCGTCGPGILRTAANAVAAAGRVVGAAVSGQRVGVSMDERSHRMAVCHACPRFSGNRCLECGCFVEAKAMLATEDCPLDRWAERDFAGARRPLFRLTHGLGDSVQFTVALRHLRAAFPGRPIAVQACDSLAEFFRPLVDRVYGAGDRIPPGEHDYIEDCPWVVPAACYADSPSTKAEAWLRLRGIAPQADLCRYDARPSVEALAAAREYLAECDALENAVLIHHTGRTARNRKTLPDSLWVGLVERLRAEGFAPIVLDWECHGRPGATVGLPGTHTPGRGHWLWHGWDRADIERLAALASLARCCVGIDSGPGHVFQASGAPTVIAWTRHHPLNFAPLSSDTIHIVPADHRRWAKGLTPQAEAFFAAHYAALEYRWDTLPDRLAEAVLMQAQSGRQRSSDPVLATTASLPDGDLRLNAAQGIAWQAGDERVEYGTAYWDKYRAYAETERGGVLRRQRDDFAAKYARSVLDIGVGCGDFVLNWTGGPAFGWDVSTTAQNWLAAHGKLLEPTADNLRTVQAVTLWDTFEHLPEPSKLLDAIPSGRYLLTSLPVFADLRRIRQSRHYRPGEHLTYWTADGLIRYLDRAGFTLLERHDRETTEAGREAIETFAFRKRPFDPPAKSALITGGIGDWFAIEQLLTGEQRDALETVYYATRQHRPIRSLWEALPNYPRLRQHVVLADDWSKRFCFVDKWEVRAAINGECPAEADWSIKVAFARHAAGGLECRQSSILRHTLTAELPGLPEEFAAIQSNSPNDQRLARDVNESEWPAIQRWASLRGLPLVSIDQSEGYSLPTAIEILKRASGYIGIDSCFSVLAARLFRHDMLKIRSVNGHLFKNVASYYPTQGGGEWVGRKFG